MAREIDALWVLISSGLVFLMEAGFLCLESGLTRSKNNINVAIKSITGFGVAALLFWGVGFALMFGQTNAGLFGTSDFLPDLGSNTTTLAVFLLFQVMFCATAVIIVSGAVAERTRFASYILIAAVMAVLIYPIFGHWAWNGSNLGSLSGWLGGRGFVDFAGSNVVHSVGGWVSLAAVLVIGARRGRFPVDGPPRKIPGSNLPLAALGTMILWFGWIGFNGGSLLVMNERVPGIVANTILAGVGGLVVTLALGWRIRGRADVDLVINGSLAGLVAITASSHAVSTASAILIGGVGGIMMLLVDSLLERLRIDDAVGAIPVHLGAGIWGTLAVGLFGQAELLGTGLDSGGQIIAQVIGIVVCFIWSFGVAYLLFNVINSIFPLRVTDEDEYIGLNVSEHGATTEVLELFTVMDRQSQTGDLSMRVPVEPFTEIGQIAARYNQVMDGLEAATARTEAIVHTALDGIITFTKGTLHITSINPAAMRMFGWSLDVVGQPLTVLLGSPDSSGMGLEAEQLDHILSQKVSAAQRFEMTGIRGNGSTFPMEVMVTEANIGGTAFFAGTFRTIYDERPG
jgi:Amt family ammonium transporter